MGGVVTDNNLASNSATKGSAGDASQLRMNAIRGPMSPTSAARSAAM
jgi:hypothetical protein